MRLWLGFESPWSVSSSAGMSRGYQNCHGKSKKVTHPGTNFRRNWHGIPAYVTWSSLPWIGGGGGGGGGNDKYKWLVHYTIYYTILYALYNLHTKSIRIYVQLFFVFKHADKNHFGITSIVISTRFPHMHVPVFGKQFCLLACMLWVVLWIHAWVCQGSMYLKTSFIYIKYAFRQSMNGGLCKLWNYHWNL